MEKGFVRKLWKFPTDTQRATILARGVPERDIWEHGVGAEDAEGCIASFRNRGGTLYIAADLRVLGENQDEIAKAVDKCERAGIRIVDLAHPELGTIAAQIKWAYARLAEYRRWRGDKNAARRTGSSGGKQRGANAAAARAERIPDDAVRKLIGLIGKCLTWRDVEDVTGISTATLRRHYLDKPKSRKARK